MVRAQNNHNLGPVKLGLVFLLKVPSYGTPLFSIDYRWMNIKQWTFFA